MTLSATQGHFQSYVFIILKLDYNTFSDKLVAISLLLPTSKTCPVLFFLFLPGFIDDYLTLLFGY